MNRKALVLYTALAGLVASGCAVGVRQPASDVTKTTATLNGTVLSTTGGAGEWYFEYGTTTARTQRTPARPIDFEPEEIVPVSEAIAGLSAGTVYHVATCAEDADNGGEALCSPDQTFHTRFETSPAQDYVIGNGTAPWLGTTSFDFEVVSGPSGENPAGWATAALNGTPLTVTDTVCLNVSGNVATTVGRLAPSPFSSWKFVLVTVVDNGPGGLDRFAAIVGIGSPFQTSPGCSAPVESPGALLSSGDITVHDAPAPSPN
jgi:hypothetical protein